MEKRHPPRVTPQMLLELKRLREEAAVRDTALEEAATICDSADKSTHPADLADRIRAKRTTASGEKGADRG